MRHVRRLVNPGAVRAPMTDGIRSEDQEHACALILDKAGKEREGG